MLILVTIPCIFLFGEFVHRVYGSHDGPCGDRCKPPWMHHHESCFRQFPLSGERKLDFQTAQQRCQSEGGNLATPTDHGQLDWLRSKSRQTSWVGLRRLEQVDSGEKRESRRLQWSWLDNPTHQINLNWKRDEPSTGDQCGVLRRRESTWFADKCKHKKAYICEKACWMTTTTTTTTTTTKPPTTTTTTTSTTTTAVAPQESKAGESNSVTAIAAGSAAGGLVLLVAIICVVVVCCRRRRRRQQQDDPDTPKAYDNKVYKSHADAEADGIIVSKISGRPTPGDIQEGSRELPDLLPRDGDPTVIYSLPFKKEKRGENDASKGPSKTPRLETVTEKTKKSPGAPRTGHASEVGNHDDDFDTTIVDNELYGT